MLRQKQIMLQQKWENCCDLAKGDCPAGRIGLGPTKRTFAPTALPLFATSLGALGLLGWCRKKKAIAA
jgi:hypothetical protein